MGKMRKSNVALIGRRYTACENLSLGNLHSARPYPIFAASVFSVCLATAAMSGCYKVASSTADDNSTESNTESAATEVLQETDSIPAADADTDTDTDTDACDSEAASDNAFLMFDAIRVVKNDPCFSGRLIVYKDGIRSAQVFVTPSDVYPNPEPNRGGWRLYGPNIDAAANRAQAVLDGLALQCSPGTEMEARIVDGGLQTQTDDLFTRIADACPPADTSGIFINDEGYVEDLLFYDVAPEVAQCIREALGGLSFPCLADTILYYDVSMRP